MGYKVIEDDIKQLNARIEMTANLVHQSRKMIERTKQEASEQNWHPSQKEIIISGHLDWANERLEELTALVNASNFHDLSECGL